MEDANGTWLFDGATKETRAAQPPWGSNHQLVTLRDPLIGLQAGMGECSQGCSDFVSVSWPQLPQLTVRSSPETAAFVRSTLQNLLTACVIKEHMFDERGYKQTCQHYFCPPSPPQKILWCQVGYNELTSVQNGRKADVFVPISSTLLVNTHICTLKSPGDGLRTCIIHKASQDFRHP